MPAHESGNCIVWEFATEYYDIGFGLFFEWETPPADLKKQMESEMQNSDVEEKLLTEIIPLTRRSSHETVFCGSHLYPSKGTYVLKFDNSFSLWRSKTLFYRVYYSR